MEEKGIPSGRIISIDGPVLDVRFETGAEPPVNALLRLAEGEFHMEVAAQIAPGVVRCTALDAPDGLRLVQKDGFVAAELKIIGAFAHGGPHERIEPAHGRAERQK